MNARLRKLLEDRAAAWSQVQDIQSRRERDGYESTQEDGETYTRALDDVDRLSREIENEERAERLRGVMDTPAPGQGDTNPRGDQEGRDAGAEYQAAFAGFLRHGMAGLDRDQLQLMQRGLVNDPEIRAGATAPGTAGGYTVPQGFLNRMVETMKSYGGIFGLAEVMTTDSGNPLSWPSNDDTGNEAVIVGENTQVGEQDFVFGNVDLGAYMYTTKMVRLSFQLLQDSAFDLEAFVSRKFGERLGRGASRHFATGTGTGQPQGITQATNVRHLAAATLGYDDFVDLEHSIDPAYRARAQYVLHDDVVRAARKLKDANRNPLWAPAMAGGIPSTINGRPYTVDNSLPALAAGSRSVVYGDIRAGYIIRVVNGAQTLRLTERYADYLQVGFLGFQRLDGKVQDNGALAVLENATAPAEG
jgi:HK97 family phage major capsid protein